MKPARRRRNRGLAGRLPGWALILAFALAVLAPMTASLSVGAPAMAATATAMAHDADGAETGHDCCAGAGHGALPHCAACLVAVALTPTAAHTQGANALRLRMVRARAPAPAAPDVPHRPPRLA